jgi:hypothetical protein
MTLQLGKPGERKYPSDLAGTNWPCHRLVTREERQRSRAALSPTLTRLLHRHATTRGAQDPGAPVFL